MRSVADLVLVEARLADHGRLEAVGHVMCLDPEAWRTDLLGMVHPGLVGGNQLAEGTGISHLMLSYLALHVLKSW